jgi:hypothetical protein
VSKRDVVQEFAAEQGPVPSREQQIESVLRHALEVKRETRRALARLPYEEKIEHWLRLKANADAIREARRAYGAEVKK